MLRKLALLAASSLLTLTVVEVAIRLGVVPLPDFVASDAWGRERFLREREGLNPRAFVALDDELGWVPAADLDGLEYQGAPIGTNARHERGRRLVPIERNERARVVAVGDSFTFGQCVGDEDTFPAEIERALADTEVVNLGVMGYGHDQALLRLRRDGLRYAPDAVVFGFHSTDVVRNGLSFFSYAKPRFRLGADGALAVENVPVPAPAEVARFWRPRLANYVEMARDALAARDGRRKRDDLALTEAILREMAGELGERGIPLLVVHLPHPADLGGSGPYGWKWLTRLCERDASLGFRCVPTLDRFRALLPTREAIDEHFRCHFSPRLQREIGRIAATALAETDPARFRIATTADPGPRSGALRGSRTDPERTALR